MTLDKASPDVVITLNGTNYKGRCSFATLWAFEKATGRNPLDGKLWLNPSPLDMIALVWAAVSKENPELTMDRIAEMMSFSELSEVTKIINALFNKGMPDEAEDSEGKKNSKTKE